MSDPRTWRPTARLRWVARFASATEDGVSMPVLQQFWGPEAPSYMRDDSIGEWRDVPMGSEAP